MRLEDMRLFAKVAEARGFTSAARLLGIPKQTLSRRISELEQELGVQLLQRTTRRLHLTDAGAAYAARCAEIVRMAEEANQWVTNTRQAPTGVPRITADPVFGEAFVTDLVLEYAHRWPAVKLDVLLTRRRVDLIEEGFDVAFRVWSGAEPGLTATRLGPARVRYCASPAYLSQRGAPQRPQELREHECILVLADGSPVRWPFRGPGGEEMVPVGGRLRFNSFAMARQAALAGLGIALFPEFACSEDVRRKRLVPVLDAFSPEPGAVWLLHPAQRFLAARVRAFVDLAVERLGKAPPWIAPAPSAPEGSQPRRR